MAGGKEETQWVSFAQFAVDWQRVNVRSMVTSSILKLSLMDWKIWIYSERHAAILSAALCCCFTADTCPGQNVVLEPGIVLKYTPSFFPKTNADQLLQELHEEVIWQRRKVVATCYEYLKNSGHLFVMFLFSWKLCFVASCLANKTQVYVKSNLTRVRCRLKFSGRRSNNLEMSHSR